MNIKSYVPELTLFDRKDEQSARTFDEDLSVVDPANGFCAVACRGRGSAVGQSVAEAYGIDPDELAFLRRALTSHKRILLQGKRGAVLLFADLLDTTGLLLAAAPKISAASAARLLRYLCRADFAITPALSAATGALQAEDKTAYDRLAALLYYTDRILSDDPNTGLWTRTLLTANFAGCLLEATSLPVNTLALSRGEGHRLIAFLLCVFLTLRNRDATVAARAPEEGQGMDEIRYQLQIQPMSGGRGENRLELPFTQIPALRDCFVSTASDGETVLEMRLHPASGHKIRATEFTLFGIRIVLTKKV